MTERKDRHETFFSFDGNLWIAAGEIVRESVEEISDDENACRIFGIYEFSKQMSGGLAELLADIFLKSQKHGNSVHAAFFKPGKGGSGVCAACEIEEEPRVIKKGGTTKISVTLIATKHRRMLRDQVRLIAAEAARAIDGSFVVKTKNENRGKKPPAASE